MLHPYENMTVDQQIRHLRLAVEVLEKKHPAGTYASEMIREKTQLLTQLEKIKDTQGESPARPYKQGWEGLDKEVRLLCDALNDLPGVETYSSCAGHGCHFFVTFFVDSLDRLLDVAGKLHGCLEFHDKGWRLLVENPAFTRNRLLFTIEGPAFGDGDALAAALRE